jgi:hypothetical protein
MYRDNALGYDEERQPKDKLHVGRNVFEKILTSGSFANAS